jgi:hypothetical protein
MVRNALEAVVSPRQVKGGFVVSSAIRATTGSPVRHHHTAVRWTTWGCSAVDHLGMETNMVTLALRPRRPDLLQDLVLGQVSKLGREFLHLNREEPSTPGDLPIDLNSSDTIVVQDDAGHHDGLPDRCFHVPGDTAAHDLGQAEHRPQFHHINVIPTHRTTSATRCS